jgi:hypothetical protein
MPIALVVLPSISCTAQRMALENDGHVGQSAVRTCERQQQHPRRTWTRPLRARGTTCRHEGRPGPRACSRIATHPTRARLVPASRPHQSRTTATDCSQATTAQHCIEGQRLQCLPLQTTRGSETTVPAGAWRTYLPATVETSYAACGG